MTGIERRARQRGHRLEVAFQALRDALSVPVQHVALSFAAALLQIPAHPLATITAECLDAQLYHPGTTSVLVRCHWNQPLPTDGMIPKSWAVPLILEHELPCWTSAQVAESWETMRPYFLGCPHGSRSSLFVNQETGQVIKNIWNALIHTGMFGPIRTDFAARP